MFSIITLYAQKKTSFGIKGGINFSNVSSEHFAENDVKTGFHFGIVTEFPFSNTFSIQPELLYSSQGTKAKQISLGSGPTSIEYHFDYVQIPVLAKIYTIKNLSFEIGPSFNFLVKSEEKTSASTNTDFGSDFELSGVLGVSYKMNNGLFGSLRYGNGFTKASNRENFDDDLKNRIFQLGIGYLF